MEGERVDGGGGVDGGWKFRPRLMLRVSGSEARSQNTQGEQGEFFS